MFDSTSCLVLQTVWDSPRPFIISALFAIVRYKYKSSQFHTHQYLLDFKSKNSMKNKFCAQFRISWYFFFNVQFSRNSWACRVRRGFQDTTPWWIRPRYKKLKYVDTVLFKCPQRYSFQRKIGSSLVCVFLTRATEDQQETEWNGYRATNKLLVSLS